MRGCRALAFVVIALVVGPSVSRGAVGTRCPRTPAPRPAPEADRPSPPGLPPLSFEANRGQTAPQVRFLVRSRIGTAFLTRSGAVFALRGRPARRDGSPPGPAADVLRMRFHGSRAAPVVEGVGGLRGRSNYFSGSDPTSWVRNVPHFARVRVRGLYPGVDLHWLGDAHRRLRYDFVVAAGADPGRIEMEFPGAQSVRIDDEGHLRVRTARGELKHRRPVLHQEVGGRRQEVDGGFALRDDGRVGFRIGPYDATRSLVIDPVLQYSTFLGGTGSDFGWRIAVDGNGAAYVAGYTNSVDFPTESPIQGARGGSWDAFVTKIDPTGSTLVYSTYLGGAGDDYAQGIAVDGSGIACVAGETGSTDFPTESALVAANAGDDDVFVAKIGANGSELLFSTYLGGGDADRGRGVAVDGGGAVYVTGYTLSGDYPTSASALQNQHGGGRFDGFVSKISADGSTLEYSTFLGGNDDDECRGVVVDGGGIAIVVGNTESDDFPTESPLQAAHGGGEEDAFVAKINAGGSSLVYSTYLGGSSEDAGRDIALDGSGAVYLVGDTDSSDFPTEAPLQVAGRGEHDVFVSKLTQDGSALVYSTYLGGAGDDRGRGIDLNAGVAYVTGQTTSSDFPVESAVQATNRGGEDVFVSKIATDGSALAYSTYLGGSADDVAWGICVDGGGAAYLAGETASADFPTRSPLAESIHGPIGGFVGKLHPVTIDLAVTKGNLKDGEKPGRDKFRAKGTFSFNADSPDGLFAPATDAAELLVGNPDDPLEVRIPAGDTGWRLNRKGSKLVWKSAKGILPKTKIVFKLGSGKFQFKVAKFDFPALQTNPVLARFFMGDDAGTETKDWIEKRPGVLTHKSPR